MNAIDYFLCIELRYGKKAERESRSVDTKEMLRMYQSARKEIRVYSGELWPFAKEPEFAKSFIAFLKANPQIKLTLVCGDVIACRNDNEGNKYNPLLLAIEQGEIKATVYYNYLKLEDQINGKYFHCFIIDSGRYIMTEIPHDYDAHTNPEKINDIRRLYFKNNKSIARSLISTFEEYIAFYELPIVADFRGVGWKCEDHEHMKGAFDENLIKSFPSIFNSEDSSLPLVRV